MPDSDDILLALGTVSVTAGVAWQFGGGLALIVLGVIALACGVLLGRSAS